MKPPPDKEPVLPASPPPWGLLAKDGTPAPAVRFTLGDRTVSYPYHTIARWEYRPGHAESLTVQAGKDVVTVQGRGLALLRDALDTGTLQQLRVMPARYAAVRSGTVVTGIAIRSPEKS